MNYIRIFSVILLVGVLIGVGIGFYNYFHFRMWETLVVWKQVFSIGGSLGLVGFAVWLIKKYW